MAKFVLLLIIALSVICMATSFSMTMSNSNADVDRRSFVNKGTTAAAVVVAGGLLSNPSKSIAADTDTAAATAEADVAATDADGFFTTESGMKYKVTKEGTGGIPTSGQTVKVS